MNDPVGPAASLPRRLLASGTRLLDRCGRNRAISGLAAMAVAQPGRLLWAAIVANAALWIGYTTVAWDNLPADPIEMAYWGREWQWGYYKLPPLPAWMAQAANLALFGAPWAPLVLSQVVVGATIWIVWRFSAELLGETRALFAAVALVGVSSFGYEAMGFSHDVAELPFRALAGWWLYRALRAERLRDWALLGLSVGLGLLAKYQFVIFMVPLAAFVALHVRTRTMLATPGPYLAMAVTLLVVTPNLLWLVGHDFFGPLQHVVSTARPSAGAWGHLLYPLEFAQGQAGVIGVAVAALVALRGGADKIAPLPRLASFDRWYITVLALGPFALTIVLAVVTGRGARASWGYSMWTFLGTFGIVFVARWLDEMGIRRFFTVLIALVPLIVGATFVAESILRPRSGAPGQFDYPGRELAARVQAGWRATTGAPLRYVVGAIIPAGNVAYYAPDRPSVVVDADLDRSSWIDAADLRQRGAVVVWPGRRDARRPPPEAFVAKFPTMVVQAPLVLPHRTWVATEPAWVEWAIVPPSPQ